MFNLLLRNKLNNGCSIIYMCVLTTEIVLRNYQSVEIQMRVFEVKLMSRYVGSEDASIHVSELYF